MIARFRCGNEERENKFWMEEDERKCRICWEERETLEHLLNECVGMKEDKRERRDILSEGGMEVEWMKEIKKIKEVQLGGSQNSKKVQRICK